MDFNTQNAKVDTGFKQPQFINIGPNELKITELTVKDSRDGLKFMVNAQFETKPVGGDFEGWEGSLGKLGRCPLSIYIAKDGSTPDARQDFLNRIASIANSLNLTNQLNAVQSSDINDYLTKVATLFNNKFAWYLIGGEEYEGQDKEGNPRAKTALKLMRFNYVAATESELLSKQSNKVWPDKTNPYFFKALVGMDSETLNSGNKPTKGDEDDGLPF